MTLTHTAAPALAGFRRELVEQPFLIPARVPP